MALTSFSQWEFVFIVIQAFSKPRPLAYPWGSELAISPGEQLTKLPLSWAEAVVRGRIFEEKKKISLALGWERFIPIKMKRDREKGQDE